jgi:hypothetical protein
VVVEKQAGGQFSSVNFLLGQFIHVGVPRSSLFSYKRFLFLRKMALPEGIDQEEKVRTHNADYRFLKRRTLIQRQLDQLSIIF